MMVVGERKWQAANSFLEKKFKKKSDFNYDETVQLALECLQSALGVDLKSSEVEVAVVTKDNTNFRKLADDAVDFHLNAIAERD